MVQVVEHFFFFFEFHHMALKTVRDDCRCRITEDKQQGRGLKKPRGLKKNKQIQ